MRTEHVFLLLVGTFTAAQASIIPNQTRQNDNCAQIYQLAVQHGNNSESITIPGTLALKCLQDLPFEPKRAASFIKEYRKLVQFESDIEILKNPPSGYQMPPTDLLGELDKIEQNAAAGEYNSQYEFDAELKALSISAYQTHFSVTLCSMSLFIFENSVPLVSISSDGTSLPEVYTKEDATHLRTSSRGPVSPIKTINGRSVADYIQGLPIVHSCQDWDTLYNLNFFSNPVSLDLSGAAGEWPGAFSENNQWPGAFHALRFANGSTMTVETVASVQDFPYRNSKEMYSGLCIPSNSSSLGSTESETPSPIPSGYPKPFIRDDFNQIMGFLPNTSHLEDVGVLAVTSFEGSITVAQNAEFNKIASGFVKQASRKGKKKILIDVSGNGGGNPLAGQNLFRIFFPEIDVYAATRFRSNEAIDLVGQAVRRLPNNATNDIRPFIYKGEVKPDQVHGFSSWKDLYGPHEILGVNSSSLTSANLTAISTPNDPINGYGDAPADPSKALFAAEDIVLITDGVCASACSIFAALMKQEGVRTIVFGGRPKNGPMQGIGGTRGALAIGLSVNGELFAGYKEAAEKSLNTSTPLLTKEQLARWDQIVPRPIAEFPLVFPAGSTNLLNNYGPHDSDTPLQFLYEAAECRRFYTLDNVFDQETVWASAADAMFDGGACVPGSTNATGSLFA
ncbi:uncharacterized protein N7484_003532 [Penicillium longicatenatum]|uniref:uncharacterized protein n=1 Tax=Penicillium longicatenatum TaxID=1561947 RepID=UPI0025476E7D|nr:uncharacterized protein N7484_003532 [Penicillium longicatenatum]KAJ5649809.1 hypothetical protein N7484_003532 [Penicillium longicatenatum]